MVKKIAFLDFWQGFIPTNNFLFHLFKQIINIEVVAPNKADIIIYSCFGNSHLRYNGVKKIFFTGENKRPNYNHCDYSISFDINDYSGRNIRIPLWYYYIDWFGVKSYNNPDYLIPVDYIDKPNIFNQKHKSKFCCAVFSNPVGTRVDMIKRLNTYKQVDCYGKPHALKLLDGERYKMDVISDYRFSLCFENTIYPGYYTEKLLHAKIAGTIPIYYSDSNMKIDFNSNSCLNLNDYESMEHLLEKVKEIDNNEKMYSEIYNEKLFNELSLDNIILKLKKIL